MIYIYKPCKIRLKMNKRYEISDFYRDFPNKEAALQYVMRVKPPDKKVYTTRLYKMKVGNAYISAKGQSYNPLKDTVFYHSMMPLDRQFFAVFLMHYSAFWSVRKFAAALGVSIVTAFKVLKKYRPYINRRLSFENMLNQMIRGEPSKSQKKS